MAADPQWLKTTLCEDLADLDRMAGRIPHTRSIERQIDEDIRVWSAWSREAKPRKVEKRPQDAQHGAAKRAAEDKGARFESHGAAPDELLTQPCPCGGTCVMCKLRARLLQLMEPLPIKERRAKVPMAQNCKHPRFAAEVIAVWTWMTLSKKAEALKRKGELNRVVFRKLADIADRSNSIIGLGAWNG